MSQHEFKNSYEYKTRLNECCGVAGKGGRYWNERFRSALEKRGLTLATARHPNDKDEWYPDGQPYYAPACFLEFPEAWPDNAIVVWRQS
jgi:hypothetical protein